MKAKVNRLQKVKLILEGKIKKEKLQKNQMMKVGGLLLENTFEDLKNVKNKLLLSE